MIHITSDFSEIDAELNRLTRMPDPKTVALLDMAMGEVALMTKAEAHVETGSLAGSVKHKTAKNRLVHTWDGDMEIGGASTGINNPVDYAIYEMARGVGGAGGPSDAKGDHNFLRPAVTIGVELLGAAVEKGVRG